MKVEDLDEEGKDDEGVLRSHVPTYDRLGVRCINFLLLGFYIVLFSASIAGIVLPCIWPNMTIPIILTFSILCAVVLLHFLVKILGKACIKGYLLYPVSPKIAYQLLDGVLLFLVIGVAANFVLDLTSKSNNGPTVIAPMVGCWLVSVAMIVNLNLIWKLTYNGPAPPPPVKYVAEDTFWDDLRTDLNKNGF